MQIVSFYLLNRIKKILTIFQKTIIFLNKKFGDLFETVWNTDFLHLVNIFEKGALKSPFFISI